MTVTGVSSGRSTALDGHSKSRTSNVGCTAYYLIQSGRETGFQNM